MGADDDIELPIYVGQGHLPDRLDKHRAWWGDHQPPMYVGYLDSPELSDDAMRARVENFLIWSLRPWLSNLK